MLKLFVTKALLRNYTALNFKNDVINGRVKGLHLKSLFKVQSGPGFRAV